MVVNSRLNRPSGSSRLQGPGCGRAPDVLNRGVRFRRYAALIAADPAASRPPGGASPASPPGNPAVGSLRRLRLQINLYDAEQVIVRVGQNNIVGALRVSPWVPSGSERNHSIHLRRLSVGIEIEVNPTWLTGPSVRCPVQRYVQPPTRRITKRNPSALRRLARHIAKRRRIAADWRVQAPRQPCSFPEAFDFAAELALFSPSAKRRAVVPAPLPERLRLPPVISRNAGSTTAARLRLSSTASSARA